MSGWNRKTGYFELTQSKAGSWLRRTDIPPSCAHLNGLDLAEGILRHHGINVIANHGSWLEVECKSSGDIWTALSGRPSDPERVYHYDKEKIPWRDRK